MLKGYNKFVLRVRDRCVDVPGERAGYRARISITTARCIGFWTTGRSAWRNAGTSVVRRDVPKTPIWITTRVMSGTPLALRPMYQWTPIMSTLLEVGYDSVKSQQVGERNGQYKITLAQQWQAGDSVWSRPAAAALRDLCQMG
ncbi:carbohydrate porin [Pantoea ananatis]